MVKEDFSPENIHNFFPENEHVKVFYIGSYYWFKNIEDFEPHDYDYLILVKSDSYDAQKFHYMWADTRTMFYDENGGKDGIINFLTSCMREGRFGSSCLNIIFKPMCDFFGITYEDIAQYLEELMDVLIKKTSTDKKYKYYVAIINFMIENKSFELSDEQLNIVYEEYKKGKLEANKDIIIKTADE